MWLTILSDQLPVLALVGRYPTNKLIGHRLLFWRQALLGSPALTIDTYVSMVLSGINLAFARLFRTIRQITYVLLTLLPLSTLQQIVRLACLIHAASVRSEPGSNSLI